MKFEDIHGTDVYFKVYVETKGKSNPGTEVIRTKGIRYLRTLGPFSVSGYGYSPEERKHAKRLEYKLKNAGIEYEKTECRF